MLTFDPAKPEITSRSSPNPGLVRVKVAYEVDTYLVFRSEPADFLCFRQSLLQHIRYVVF